MRQAVTYCLPVGLALAASTGAWAQSDTRGVDVASRPRPQYDAQGVRVGSFRLYPAASVSANATDNYLARDVNRRGDAFFVALPEVTFNSEWSRHRIGGRVHFNQSVHTNLTGENTSQYGALVNGTVDVSRETVLRAEASAAHSVEARANLGSFANSQRPVGFDAYHAAIGATQQFNRLRLDGSLGINKLTYQDVNDLNGNLIDQNFRDYTRYSQAIDAQYDVGGGIGIVLGGDFTQNRFKFRPGSLGFNPLTSIDRTSSGMAIEGGVSLELSSLVFGVIRAGYRKQDYSDPRLINFSGLSFNANVVWNVTPLTSLRFRLARAIDDTSSQVVAGNTRNDYSINADHELYRNIIVSSNLRYVSFKPNGPGDGGREYGIGASARYLVNRNWSASLAANYARRDSTNAFLRFRAVSLMLSSRFAL